MSERCYSNLLKNIHIAHLLSQGLCKCKNILAANIIKVLRTYQCVSDCQRTAGVALAYAPSIWSRSAYCWRNDSAAIRATAHVVGDYLEIDMVQTRRHARAYELKTITHLIFLYTNTHKISNVVLYILNITNLTVTGSTETWCCCPSSNILVATACDTDGSDVVYEKSR